MLCVYVLLESLIVYNNINDVIVVRKINSIDASGDSMNICDPNGQPQCQSISHATTIHIELLLTIPCDSESMRNDIRCDIDDMLNMTLSEIAETSTPVIPCTMLNDNGMDCRALITVLDNLMVSQNLTRQLFEQLKQLVNNGSNTTVSIIWRRNLVDFLFPSILMYIL